MDKAKVCDTDSLCTCARLYLSVLCGKHDIEDECHNQSVHTLHWTEENNCRDKLQITPNKSDLFDY